jgi:uncharacterized membrane protein (UPF0127 family)
VRECAGEYDEELTGHNSNMRRSFKLICGASRPVLVAAGALLSFIACGGGEAPADTTDVRIVPFDVTDVRIATARDTTIARVELAISKEQKTMGLMERRRLAGNAGMLFIYDSTQGPEAGFWMFRTRIPLDIAYVDSAGVIRNIQTMLPCETTIPEGCTTYLPNVAYQYALEANAGFFERRGIKVGDRLLLGDLASRAKQ